MSDELLDLCGLTKSLQLLTKTQPLDDEVEHELLFCQRLADLIAEECGKDGLAILEKHPGLEMDQMLAACYRAYLNEDVIVRNRLSLIFENFDVSARLDPWDCSEGEVELCILRNLLILDPSYDEIEKAIFALGRSFNQRVFKLYQIIMGFF